MTEKEAAKAASDQLATYNKIGPDTRRTLEEAIPAVVHILYLGGYLIVPAKSNG